MLNSNSELFLLMVVATILKNCLLVLMYFSSFRPLKSYPHEGSKVLVQVWSPSSKENHPSLNRFDLPVLEITMWIVMDDDRRLTNYDYKNNRNLDIENVLPGRRTTHFRNNNNIGSSHDIAENVWLGIQRHVVVCLKPTQHIVYNIKLIRGSIYYRRWW